MITYMPKSYLLTYPKMNAKPLVVKPLDMSLSVIPFTKDSLTKPFSDALIHKKPKLPYMRYMNVYVEVISMV